MDQEKARIRSDIRKIRGILIDQWDPIGVRDIPEAAGEYNGYAPGIYGLLMRRVSDDELVEHLKQIETGHMGLGSCEPEHLRQVVRALRDSLSRP